MLVMRTTENLAYPLGELVSTKHSLGLDLFALAVNAFVNKGKKRRKLSWMSSRKKVRRLPGSTVFEDGVEDREQLAHAGHQSHLLRFAGRQKTLVEFLYDRVAARVDQGAHVQCRSDVGPPSPHATT